MRILLAYVRGNLLSVCLSFADACRNLSDVGTKNGVTSVYFDVSFVSGGSLSVSWAVGNQIVPCDRQDRLGLEEKGKSIQRATSAIFMRDGGVVKGSTACRIVIIAVSARVYRKLHMGKGGIFVAYWVVFITPRYFFWYLYGSSFSA